MYQDLRSKLALYKRNQEKKEVQPQKSQSVPLDDLRGTVCYYKDMPYFAIENVYPASFQHGGFLMGDALHMDVQYLTTIYGNQDQNISVKDFIFLDTETTGLSGGAGTVAFLIGVGFFEGDSFVLRQYFMRDYHEEGAVLSALHELLAEHRVLVTFNGKSFDWNLLKTRFICNRLRLGMKEPVQLDLLYPSRSIWKLKLRSCRLSSIEENILNEKRVDDIPGYRIPETYFKYLEDRNVSDIRKVIKHNELDILSLVSLLLKIHSMLKDPMVEIWDERELLGIGRIFERKGDMEKAVKCYRICTNSDNNMIKGVTSRRLAGVYKKNGDFDKAAELLEKIVKDAAVPILPVMIELAKHYEHKEKNLKKALSIVEDAMSTTVVTATRNSLYYRDLKKRCERLKRKLASKNCSPLSDIESNLDVQ